jgi:uncharacterized protein YjbI with pentapeptide repeats
LADADLTDATLAGTDLRGANLTDTVLLRADLTDADLVRADLSGANLTAAKGLTEEQLERAIGDGDTVLPPEMRRPKSWS